MNGIRVIDRDSSASPRGDQPMSKAWFWRSFRVELAQAWSQFIVQHLFSINITCLFVCVCMGWCMVDYVVTSWTAVIVWDAMNSSRVSYSVVHSQLLFLTRRRVLHIAIEGNIDSWTNRSRDMVKERKTATVCRAMAEHKPVVVVHTNYASAGVGDVCIHWIVLPIRYWAKAWSYDVWTAMCWSHEFIIHLDWVCTGVCSVEITWHKLTDTPYSMG